MGLFYISIYLANQKPLLQSMKNLLLALLFTITLHTRAQQVEVWLTNADKSALLQKQNQTLKFGNEKTDSPTIFVDDTKKFQTMDGFGFTLTGGSATLINQLNETEKADLLKELFATNGNNIGISYLRISIGASDLSDHVFTYNDLPNGETDINIEKFSLTEEQKDLIPVLKQILRINPTIKILGSPWTPPVWMKTNGNSKGGSLKPEYYQAYAKYLSKYIQAMQKEGIRIDAITIQNEPLHPGNNPSLLMLPSEQATFIKKNLGPLFKTTGIKTKIILYDHNADRPDYPISILNDPEARKYIDGSAFHLYGGTVEALADVHEAHPDKHLYFTEQWIGAPGNFAGDLKWHVKNLIIGAPRNWSRNVLEWNLAADPKQNPHTDGGCTECLGALTIGKSIIRNPAYYIVGHASKFARPGSVRIASNITMSLANVAFRTSGGKTVLIVLNESDKPQSFTISYKGKTLSQALNGGSVATYVW